MSGARDSESAAGGAAKPGPIALCLAGQLRSLLNPTVAEKLRQRLLDRLQPDVFVRASAEQHSCMVMGTNGAAPWPRHNDCVQLLSGSSNNQRHEGALREFLEQHGRLRAWSVQPDAAIAPSQSGPFVSTRLERRRVTPDAPSCAVDFQNRVWTPLAVRWEGCLADIEAAEAANGIRYAWVIQSRPDLRWACRPDISLLLRPNVVSVQSDLFWIAERQIAGRLKRPMVEVATIWRELLPSSMIAPPRQGEPRSRERPPSNSSREKPFLSRMTIVPPGRERCDGNGSSAEASRDPAYAGLVGVHTAAEYSVIL